MMKNNLPKILRVEIRADFEQFNKFIEKLIRKKS